MIRRPERKRQKFLRLEALGDAQRQALQNLEISDRGLEPKRFSFWRFFDLPDQHFLPDIIFYFAVLAGLRGIADLHPERHFVFFRRRNCHCCCAHG